MVAVMVMVKKQINKSLFNSHNVVHFYLVGVVHDVLVGPHVVLVVEGLKRAQRNYNVSEHFLVAAFVRPHNAQSVRGIFAFRQ